MLHLIYIVAFTILALIAVSNLIRNLLMFSFERDRNYPEGHSSRHKGGAYSSSHRAVPHPELLDTDGNPIKEPLLVMRSITVEDARQQLDALYDSSPGSRGEQDND